MAAADGRLESTLSLQSANRLQSSASSLLHTDKSLSPALGSASGAYADSGSATERGNRGGGEVDGEGRAGADGQSSSFSFRMDSGRWEGLKEAASGAEAVADPFEDGELKIIEDALKCLRRRSNSETGRTEDLAGRADGEDEDGVGKLLRKVQGVRSKSGKQEPAGPFRGDEAPDVERIVRAASQAALAAAKAAEAALALSNRNSQAIERLSKTLNRSRQSPAGEGEGEDDEDANSSGAVEIAAPEMDGGPAEINKRVEKQNRITHWVLGFMVVSSIVWRFGVVKFLMNLNETIQNPLQGVSDSFNEWTGFGDKKGKDQDGPSIPAGAGNSKSKDLKSLATQFEDGRDEVLKFGREMTGNEDDKKSHKKTGEVSK